MSTRALIKAEDNNVQLYVHSDGYPEGKNGIIERIRPFILNFMKQRGWDEKYLMARITGHLIRLYDERSIELHKQLDAKRTNEYIGFGLFSGQDFVGVGEDFQYLITPKSIEVYSHREKLFELFHESSTYEITFDEETEKYTLIQN